MQIRLYFKCVLLFVFNYFTALSTIMQTKELYRKIAANIQNDANTYKQST